MMKSWNGAMQLSKVKKGNGKSEKIGADFLFVRDPLKHFILF